MLEELESLEPILKPMFGAWAIYKPTDEGAKILIILRDKPTHLDSNGIWLATSAEHHESLRRDFPTMTDVKMFRDEGDTAPTSWQVLPSQESDFEEAAMRLIELLLQDDPRIGKIPKAKRRGAEGGATASPAVAKAAAAKKIPSAKKTKTAKKKTRAKKKRVK